MEDDTYGGYYIPKGTLILANIWYVSLHSTFITQLFMQLIRFGIIHQANDP